MKNRVRFRLVRSGRGASRSGIRPSLNQLTELLLGSGRWYAPCPRVPAPPHQFVLRHMLDQRGEVLAAVAVLVLDLDADLLERFALPSHLRGRKRPLRIPGDPGRIEIGPVMTGRADQAAWRAHAAIAAHHQ